VTSESDEVRAAALWHFDGAARASAIPLILLQYRPQAVKTGPCRSWQMR
jgi:hypothetical protein